MRLTIDNTRCQGHGRCYDLAPELFTDDDSGYGEVAVPDVPADRVELARRAAEACPERAVLLDGV
ncbi:ferredoxin [Frankia sp. QA3]|uniref:ferredoxin n=1 Tax=Frankia sp. QA3 TaxID=710111 RepID=UPI000269BCDF|nr:ferredoxin [Frankia sp. QA3]EIV92268.1 ferredoxin [Frankia sp. QA3]